MELNHEQNSCFWVDKTAHLYEMAKKRKPSKVEVILDGFIKAINACFFVLKLWQVIQDLFW